MCKVTFTVLGQDAKKVCVVGDFNNWDPTENELKRLKNGSFKGTYDIPKENSYEFRYLIDGSYSNEAEADGFQWNEYAGTENAVLEL